MFYLYYEEMIHDCEGPIFIGKYDTIHEAWMHVQQDHINAMKYELDEEKGLLPWEECPRYKSREKNVSYVSSVFEIPEELPKNPLEPIWISVHKKDTFFVVQEEWNYEI